MGAVAPLDAGAGRGPRAGPRSGRLGGRAPGVPGTALVAPVTPRGPGVSPGVHANPQALGARPEPPKEAGVTGASPLAGDMSLEDGVSRQQGWRGRW